MEFRVYGGDLGFGVWGFSVVFGVKGIPSLNEIGHSFLCNKSPVHIPKGRARSTAFVKVQYTVKYDANEMRGHGLRVPRKAQVKVIINESRR